MARLFDDGNSGFVVLREDVKGLRSRKNHRRYLTEFVECISYESDS